MFSVYLWHLLPPLPYIHLYIQYVDVQSSDMAFQRQCRYQEKMMTYVMQIFDFMQYRLFFGSKISLEYKK